jgi:hypothetical protein
MSVRNMSSKKKSSPRVSLASELSVLEASLNGVRIVLEHLTTQPSGSPDTRAIESAIGLIAVIAARIRLCRRVVIGAEPARTILAPHNAVVDRHPGDDPDILVT